MYDTGVCVMHHFPMACACSPHHIIHHIIHHTISYHTIPYHIIPCQTISYHIKVQIGKKGKANGFVYIEFVDSAALTKSLSMDGAMVNGKKISCRRSKQTIGDPNPDPFSCSFSSHLISSHAMSSYNNGLE